MEYNPTSIISYASCDISNGEIYLKLGFNKVKQTKPSYWYIEPNTLIRHHRFSCRKDLLVKKGYDSSKTEYEILNEMKYHRIYDSGQYEFVYSNK